MDKIKLEKVILENTKTIFAFFIKKGLNEFDASDLTQDTILAILKASDKIINENAIYGYVFSIANNLYKKYLSNKKNHTFVELTDAYYKVESNDFDEEKLKLLKRELAFLSYHYRKCVILYYFKNYSLKDVAKKLNISLEMAKYYLFKTRKKLKEGMEMNREFGKRSYDPETFYFSNSYFGNYNSDLENLFNRKIVGNILLACYYTPMSLLELAIELGVANVYVEDEVNILLSYHLLKKTGNKYQTNCVILTTDFLDDFVKLSRKTIIESMSKIFNTIDKLNTIEGLKCDWNNKNDLKWSLLPLILQHGSTLFQENFSGEKEFDKLFKSADTISYGTNIEPENKYQTSMRIGYAPILQNYGISLISPNAFPEDYRNNWDTIVKDIEQNLNKYVVVTNEEKVNETLKDVYDISKIMHENLFKIMKDTLLTYSPKIIHNKLDGVIYHILDIASVGIICYQILDKKILKLPQDKHPITLVYKQ